MGGAKLQRTLEIGQGGVNVIIPEEEAVRIVKLYRNKNHRIVRLWDACDKMLRDMVVGKSGELAVSRLALAYEQTSLCLPNKMHIQYPFIRADVNDSMNGIYYIDNPRTYDAMVKDRVLGVKDVLRHDSWAKIYGGKVVENLVQALAALVIRQQMAEIGQRYKVVFQVHDEIIIVAKEAQAEEAMADLMNVMSTPPDWAPGLPLACEAGFAKAYGDT